MAEERPGASPEAWSSPTVERWPCPPLSHRAASRACKQTRALRVRTRGIPSGRATVAEVHRSSPLCKDRGAAQSGRGKESTTPPTACCWRLPGGTRAAPLRMRREDAESLHPTRGNAADQVGLAFHNHGHIVRPGRRPPPAPCTSFLGAWARGFAAQRWPRNAFAGAISGRGVSAFCASATSCSKHPCAFWRSPAASAARGSIEAAIAVRGLLKRRFEFA